MTGRRPFAAARVALTLLAVGAAPSLAPRAAAHGGLPRAFQIVVEPGNPDDVLLRSDLWGFFRTRDAGKTWQWTCAEVYGGNSLSVSHQGVAIAPGGRLFVANSFKGLFHTDDGCAWTSSSELDGTLVADVEVAPGSVLALSSTNTGGSAGISGLLWQSTDGGDHFQTTGAALPTDFAATDLAVAPSDGKRLYVTGRTLEAGDGALVRSDDGGASWQPFPIPVSDPLMTVRIAGVHPTRPDVLFVWGDLKEELGQDAPDEIWGTTDGGATWSDVYSGSGDLPGFAFSPDGTKILVGGPREGLELGNIDDAFASGQPAFSEYFTTPTRPEPGDRQVWGLLWNASGLRAGTDNFTRKGIPGFTYGLFSDQERAFSELMSICQASYGSCGANSTVAVACGTVFDDPLGGFEQDYLESARCQAAPDAGSGDGGGASPGAADAGTATDGGTTARADGGGTSGNGG